MHWYPLVHWGVVLYTTILRTFPIFSIFKHCDIVWLIPFIVSIHLSEFCMKMSKFRWVYHDMISCTLLAYSCLHRRALSDFWHTFKLSHCRYRCQLRSECSHWIFYCIYVLKENGKNPYASETNSDRKFEVSVIGIMILGQNSRKNWNKFTRIKIIHRTGYHRYPFEIMAMSQKWWKVTTWLQGWALKNILVNVCFFRSQ